MGKKRIKVSNTVWGKLFQEAGHHCAFCPEAVVSSLEIHHIDGNPVNDDLENLMLVCASCHKKITTRVTSEADVRQKKRQLRMSGRKPPGFSGDDWKGFRPSLDHNDPNDPIDWDHFHLRPEDFA